MKRCDERRAEAGLAPLRVVLVLTKADKKDAKAGHTAQAKLRAQLADVVGEARAAAAPFVVTSSVSKQGRDALWRELRPVVLADQAAG